MTSLFNLVVAAAEQNNRNKDYPQATVIVVKKAFDTHSEFTSLIDFNISYDEVLKNVT